MKRTLAGNIWLDSVLAPLCSDFGIGSNDPTADAGGSPLLSPAGIAGIVLAAVIALLCAAALIGKLQSTLHVTRTLPPGIEQTCSTCPRVGPHDCSQAGMQQPSQEATVLWCCHTAMDARMRRKRLHDANNRTGKDDGGLGNFDEKLQGGCSCTHASCRHLGASTAPFAHA